MQNKIQALLSNIRSQARKQTYHQNPSRTPTRGKNIFQTVGDVTLIYALKKGEPVIGVIDTVDLPLVKQYHWSVTGVGYLFGHKKGEHTKQVYLHRLLANTPPSLSTDHIDGVRLNNRRSNLRIATWSSNGANRRKCVTRTSSKYKGVSWDYNKWSASIKVNGKKRRLGRYDSEEAAARRYDEVARQLFGSFARTNFAEAC